MPVRIFKGIVRNTGPALALQEVLYGFIMALIFVSAARMGILHYESRMELVLMIVGMNFTWGAIDATVFYLIDVFNQRKFVRLMDNTDAIGRERAAEMLMEEFSGTPLDILDPDDERAVCMSILDKRMESRDDMAADRRDMRNSAIGCFLITVLTTIPIVLPIVLVDEIKTGLAFASVLSAIILFFVGYRMERYTGVNRWVMGIFLTGVSWAITIIATFTGG